MKVKDLNRKEMHCDCEDCKDCEKIGIITITSGDIKQDYIHLAEVNVEGKRYFVTVSQTDEESELRVIQQKQQNDNYPYVTDVTLKENILKKFQTEYNSDTETEIITICNNEGEKFVFEIFGEVKYKGNQYWVVAEIFFAFFEVKQDTDELVDCVCDPELEEKIFKAYIEE